MGGAFSKNLSDIQQNVITNLTQQNSTSCVNTVSATTNNNVLLIEGSTIGGDVIGARQTVSTDVSCVITANMDAQIRSILSATLNQTNKTNNDLFGGFNWSKNTNIFNMRQSIANNIAQINSAVCSSNTLASAQNNFVYIRNANVRGNVVGVEQKVNAKSGCTINNVMKMVSYNQQQADSNQGNTAIGMFAGLFSGIISIITILIIGVVIVFALGAVGYIGYSVFGKSSPPPPPQEAAPNPLEEYGLTDEQLLAGPGIY